MLKILYLSNTLIAVDKPAGIIVHGDGTGAETLTVLVRAHLVDRSLDANELQALQRLDRETSGVVLFSRAKATQGIYDHMIAAHEIEKRYRALAAGAIPWDERDLTWSIGRDRHDARRMRASRTGKPALTHARVLRRLTYRGRPCTLLDLRIETGRRHQIRVHLSRAGFPLVGDALYGAPDPQGLMLHAMSLCFTDPLTGEAVSIEAPLPDRMSRLLPRDQPH